jgi:hypothetical protein
MKGCILQNWDVERPNLWTDSFIKNIGFRVGDTVIERNQMKKPDNTIRGEVKPVSTELRTLDDIKQWVSASLPNGYKYRIEEYINDRVEVTIYPKESVVWEDVSAILQHLVVEASCVAHVPIVYSAGKTIAS